MDREPDSLQVQVIPGVVEPMVVTVVTLNSEAAQEQPMVLLPIRCRLAPLVEEHQTVMAEVLAAAGAAAGEAAGLAVPAFSAVGAAGALV